VPRDKEEHGKNPTRESTDEHCILDANPVSVELLATAVRKSAVKLCISSAVSTITISMAAIAAILPSVASNTVNPAATAHSGNLATASRKLIKASVKFGTSELQTIVVLRDYHANHRRICYGIRNKEAVKQLLQICEYHHQRWSSCPPGVGEGANHLYRRRFQVEIRDPQ
jgi:hypothetical protein